MEELVAIARVVKPRGLKGEVVAEVLTDFPERFHGLEDVTAVLPNGSRAELKIEAHWFQKARIVLKFQGYDTIESVEELRDAEICITESEAVELESDEYFDWQLIGCEVVTVDGVAVGTVESVMRTGGTEILEVKGIDKGFLVPFAESICTEVDVENKRIVIDPPDGLLDF
jgi:16S rRNA processing protein RimM